MLPYIYTPTVGEASLDYSNIYSQNRGIYITYSLKDKLAEMIMNIPRTEVDVIVVTDGSRILGLGDVGIGGMTIPVGKLTLYTLFGGIHPARTLPVMLDLGTDNPELLDNPLYLGWRHPRVHGAEYDAFVDSFVVHIKKKFPNVLLQWEDFAKPHAQDLLARYRNVICSFNDDIQGTASVALAAILSAINTNSEKLIEQRIVIVGGGGAGMGIANILEQYMVYTGASEQEARSRFYIVDRPGLLHSKIDAMDKQQQLYARDIKEVQSWSKNDNKKVTLEEVIDHAKPTILIGVSAQEGIFTETLVKKMAKNCKRPIIFPLSNPTSKAEAKPENLIKWTDGKAIVATGSPPTVIDYKNHKVNIAQCNNVYIFPGVGLGIIATQSKAVTDEMFFKAAETLAKHSPILSGKSSSLFPCISTLRKVSREIGIEVAKLAIEQGLSQISDTDAEKLVDRSVWSPKYPRVKKSSSF